jgi:RNA polymerase sigma factor (sigma-70 family)
MLQDSIALENEIAAQISDFEPLVNRQYPLLLKLCRKVTNDKDEATGIVHDAIRKFFQQIWTDMWIGDLREFTSPEAWLTRTTLNACGDFRRERYQRKHGERPKKIRDTTVFPKPKFRYLYAHELPQIENEDGQQLDVVECALESALGSLRRNAEESAFDREILMRYLTALRQLTPVQCAVYILYKDELLQPEEQEQLLGLDASASRIVIETIRAQPQMRLVDVANLLGRIEGTLSSELTRAKVRLQRELSDLLWRKPSKLPVPKWSREFLAGYSGRHGSFSSFRVRLEEHETLEKSPWLISARDKEYVRGMPGPKRRHENLKTPSGPSYHGTPTYSMDMVPGWFKAPEPDDPQYIDLLKTIRERLQARKRYTTIAKVLNATHVPPRFGKTWHHTAVRLIARRAGLVKTAQTIRSVPLPASALAPNESTPGRIADNIATEVFHWSEAAAGDVLSKTPGRSRAGKIVSARRMQRSKPAHKARRNARNPRKTSRTVPGKRRRIRCSAKVGKAPRRKRAAQRPPLKPERQGKRGRKLPSQAQRVVRPSRKRTSSGSDVD